MEEEPEWSQPQSCSAKAADEGTAASPGGHPAASILWVSLQAVTQVSCTLSLGNGVRTQNHLINSCAHQLA